MRPEDLPKPAPRPRLLISAERLELLKRAAGGEGDEILVELARRCLAQAEGIAEAVRSSRIEEHRMDGDGGDRGWYNVLGYLALAYLITGKKPLLDALSSRLDELVSLRPMGLESDLAVSHMLLNFSVAYDWLGDRYDPALTRRLKEHVVAEADMYYRSFALQCDYYHDCYLQNHHHADVMGLTAAGACLLGEVPQAALWLAEAVNALWRIRYFHPPDGSSCEGPSYANFGYEMKTLAAAIAEGAAGVDILGRMPELKGVSRYLMAHIIPGFSAERNVFPVGDCAGRLDKHGPAHYLWLLARKVDDLLAQGLAIECVRRRVGTDAPLSWLGLLWYEPRPGTAGAEWPCTIHCPDIDIVSHRTGWAEDDTAVFFECGPFQGRKAEQMTSRDMGGAHVHPDSGCFLVVRSGEYLAGDPAGYTTNKLTAHHNCILVDGAGQLGEGMTWFNVNECLHYSSTARIAAQGAENGLFWVVGEYVRRYHPRLHMKTMLRLLVYQEPDLVVVYDDLASDDEHDYTWLVHPGEGVESLVSGKGFEMRGESACLRGVVKAPAGHRLYRGQRTVEDRAGQLIKEPQEIAVTHRGRDVEFMVVMGLSAAVEPDTCRLEGRGSKRQIILLNGRRLDINLETLEVQPGY